MYCTTANNVVSCVLKKYESDNGIDLLYYRAEIPRVLTMHQKGGHHLIQASYILHTRVLIWPIYTPSERTLSARQSYTLHNVIQFNLSWGIYISVGLNLNAQSWQESLPAIATILYYLLHC